MVSFLIRGRITHVEVGGHDSWVMYGPVFFSQNFSLKVPAAAGAGITTPQARSSFTGRMC